MKRERNRGRGHARRPPRRLARRAMVIWVRGAEPRRAPGGVPPGRHRRGVPRGWHADRRQAPCVAAGWRAIRLATTVRCPRVAGHRPAATPGARRAACPIRRRAAPRCACGRPSGGPEASLPAGGASIRRPRGLRAGPGRARARPGRSVPAWWHATRPAGDRRGRREADTRASRSGSHGPGPSGRATPWRLAPPSMEARASISASRGPRSRRDAPGTSGARRLVRPLRRLHRSS